MKRVWLCFFSFIILFACNCSTPKSVHAEEQESFKIEHFFSHELVYNPSKAYSPNNSLRKCFDRDHLTASEFKKILEELYERNYILVDIEDVYEMCDGKWVVKKNLDFGNKKPFILSFDDMTYDTKNRGIVEKIVVKNGELYDFTSCEEIQYSKERDGITILENFIKQFPDFSYNNARAILCVTGYNGAFGYRVFSETYLKDAELESEKQQLKELMTLLKKKRYRLGCHSYSHCNCVYTSYGNFIQDLSKWKSEIGEFVGETNIYCYPGGLHKTGSANNEYLKEIGFNIFLCTGKTEKKEETEDVGATYFYRHPLDGTALRLCEEEYSDFFDTKEVYDSARYLPYSYKHGY